jgi:hypothetical protein
MATNNPLDYYLNLSGYGQSRQGNTTNTGFGGVGSPYDLSTIGYSNTPSPMQPNTYSGFGGVGNDMSTTGFNAGPGMWDKTKTAFAPVKDFFADFQGTKDNPGWGATGLDTAKGVASLVGSLSNYLTGKSAYAQNMDWMKQDRAQRQALLESAKLKQYEISANMRNLSGDAATAYINKRSNKSVVGA